MKGMGLEKRLKIYLIAVIVIFVSLATRLFYLQVLSASEFRTRSEQNCIRLFNIMARRGDIVDRNGKVLATSKPVFSVYLSPFISEEQRGEVINRLVQTIGDPELTAEVLKSKIEQNARPYDPVEVVTLPWGDWALEVISRLEEQREYLPGVVIEAQPMRYYPQGSLAGHLLGYVGKIDKKELQQNLQYGYDMHDLIGKTGLEKSWELRFAGEREIGLRGQDGARQVEVDVYGRPVRELMAIMPVPGNNLVLTLDADLQAVLERSMDEVISGLKKSNPKAGAGAAVVLDVQSGAILAMASKPDINPNDFVDGSFEEKKSYYLDSEHKPMLNRAIQSAYPPGSTFKMITALAALEAGVVDPLASIVCDGKYPRPGGLNCWDVHKTVNFFTGFARSCNTYFQWLGELAGIDMITSVGRELGLGQKTGFEDVAGEVPGVLPSRERKQEVGTANVEKRHQLRLKELEAKYEDLLNKAATPEERQAILKQKDREQKLLESQYQIELAFESQWQPFDTYNTSIGQGDTNVTVLQLASYVSAIANGGKLYRPYVVSKVISPTGEVLHEASPQLLREAEIKPENLELVRQGMRAVCEPGGTGYSLVYDFPPEVRVAGKTGTAQTGRKGDDPKKDFHGVFVAFAPYENPKIAFACIIEYGRQGNTSAGRVARDVLRHYFGLDS